MTGFFDGEGTVLNHRYSPGRYLVLGLTFYNTDRNVLERIRAFINAGRIYATKRPPRKTEYALTVRGHVEALRVAEAMLPYAIVKRIALLDLVDELRARPSTRRAMYRQLSGGRP